MSVHMGAAGPDRPLADLDLAAVRAYRQALVAEEDRVSYWRRLVHARIDVLEAQADVEEPLTPSQLVRVLGDTGSGRSRQALARVVATEPLPVLPELEQLWLVAAEPEDETARADAIGRLREVEAELTNYRRVLHARLDEATGRLIELYHSNPAAALSLLPGG